MIPGDASAWFVTPLQILLVDLLLGADNALVIALACRRLPPSEVKQAAAIGVVGAIVVRTLLAVVATALLSLPFVKLLGAFALLVIAMNLVGGDALEEGEGATAGGSLWSAAAIIIVADTTMGVDNVIALAAIAKGNYLWLAMGVALSLPIIAFGGVMLAGLMSRAPWLVEFGAALLGWIALDMAVADPIFGGWIASNAPGLEALAPVLGALFVMIYGRWAIPRKAPARMDGAPQPAPAQMPTVYAPVEDRSEPRRRVTVAEAPHRPRAPVVAAQPTVNAGNETGAEPSRDAAVAQQAAVADAAAKPRGDALRRDVAEDAPLLPRTPDAAAPPKQAPPPIVNIADEPSADRRREDAPASAAASVEARGEPSRREAAIEAPLLPRTPDVAAPPKQAPPPIVNFADEPSADRRRDDAPAQKPAPAAASVEARGEPSRREAAIEAAQPTRAPDVMQPAEPAPQPGLQIGSERRAEPPGKAAIAATRTPDETLAAPPAPPTPALNSRPELKVEPPKVDESLKEETPLEAMIAPAAPAPELQAAAARVEAPSSAAEADHSALPLDLAPLAAALEEEPTARGVIEIFPPRSRAPGAPEPLAVATTTDDDAEPDDMHEPAEPATRGDRAAIIGVLLLAIAAGVMLMIVSYLDSLD